MQNHTHSIPLCKCAAVAAGVFMQIVKEGRITYRTPAPERLTARERQVVRLLATGAGLPQIARQLGVEHTTIKAHAAAAVRKTGTAGTFELAVMAAAGRVAIDDEPESA